MHTVLIVDDDKKLLEMLRRTLAYDGYRVVLAEDGHAALSQFDAVSYADEQRVLFFAQLEKERPD